MYFVLSFFQKTFHSFAPPIIAWSKNSYRPVYSASTERFAVTMQYGLKALFSVVKRARASSRVRYSSALSVSGSPVPVIRFRTVKFSI